MHSVISDPMIPPLWRQVRMIRPLSEQVHAPYRDKTQELQPANIIPVTLKYVLSAFLAQGPWQLHTHAEIHEGDQGVVQNPTLVDV